MVDRFQIAAFDLIGGRDAVLSATKDMLHSTHPLTKAGNASNVDPDSARRHVIDTILAASVKRLMEPLAEDLRVHMNAVRDEFEMMEGERPENNEHARQAWLAGLYGMIGETFRGQIVGILGEPKLDALMAMHAPPRVIAEALIVRPIVDKGRALKALELTPGDIEALTIEAGIPVEALAATRAGALANSKDNGPMPDVEWVEPDSDATPGEWAEGEPAEKIDWDAVEDTAESAPVFATSEASSIDWDTPTAPAEPASADINWDAPTDEATEGEGEKRRMRGRAIPLGGKHGPLAALMVEAVEALCNFTSATEAEVATAINVSRAQMNNYRKVKTVWEPTPTQCKALATKLSRYHSAISFTLDKVYSVTINMV